MKAAPFFSDLALLDVKTGRAALLKRLNGLKRGKVHVLVDMTVDYAYGGDDGASQEFVCTVRSVKEFAR